MPETSMTAAQRAAFNAAAAAKCNAEFHARRILEGKRPAWVTQEDIDRIAAVAADDVRRAAGGRIDINPYSTTGVRAC